MYIYTYIIIFTTGYVMMYIVCNDTSKDLDIIYTYNRSMSHFVSINYPAPPPYTFSNI